MKVSSLENGVRRGRKRSFNSYGELQLLTKPMGALEGVCQKKKKKKGEMFH